MNTRFFNLRNGEQKHWYNNQLHMHCFMKDGNDITTTIKELCDDILCITDQEKMLIKLKFGIDCL